MSEVIDRNEFPDLWARMKLPIPKEKVAQIHEFATDLAVGFNDGAWPSNFLLSETVGGDNWALDEGAELLEELESKKWGGTFPKYHSLISMGYLTHSRLDTYELTEKALSLVDEPVTQPNLFISYKRSESSAFALLLEARIKYETNATPFLDKSIEPGDDWHPRLEEKVKSCEAFVCVIWRGTLDSKYVQNEIRWALSNGKNNLILPVWHNEYDGSHPNDPLQSKQAVIVGDENTKNYDSAVNEIMNRLGFSPQFIAQR